MNTAHLCQHWQCVLMSGYILLGISHGGFPTAIHVDRATNNLITVLCLLSKSKNLWIVYQVIF